MGHPVKVHQLLLVLTLVFVPALTASAVNPITPSSAPVSPSATSGGTPQPASPAAGPVEEDEDLDVKPIAEVSASDPFGRKAARAATKAAAKAAAQAAEEASDDGESDQDDQAPPAPRYRLMREGKRLFDREGAIRRQGNETRMLIDKENLLIVLLPTKSLERVEDLSDYGRRKTRFMVCGVVCEYRGRNYLLLDTDRSPRMVGAKQAADPEGQPGRPGGNETAAAPAASPARNRDLPPEAIERDVPGPLKIRPLLARRPREVGPPSLLRQDKKLVDREGRIIRSNRQTQFVFDNGDKPIVLLPNGKLERMEDMADFGRRQMRFRISGTATEYRSRNYLLMSKMVVIPKEVEKL